MKKITNLVVITLILMIGLTGCHKVTDGERFKEEYESLNNVEFTEGETYNTININANNIIKYASIDEVINIIENETGVIYLGSPENLICRNIVPALLEASDSTPIEEIYYLNIDKEKEILSLDENNNVVVEQKASSSYSKLLNLLNEASDDYILEDHLGNQINTNKKTISLPLVLFIKDGKIIDYHKGTVPSQEDLERPLTENENNELINIYKEKITKVKINSCSTNEERC